MFNKVSHVGWIATITLILVIGAIAAHRKTKETIIFEDGSTAEIKRTFNN